MCWQDKRREACLTLAKDIEMEAYSSPAVKTDSGGKESPNRRSRVETI